ncbi:Niemann-Pick type C1 disease protein/ patched like cholesterol transporter of the SecD family, 12 transmembrane domain, related [Neospora caninum Liverpool]|uniref:Niemann-Pick type C1 disease protein/ patched like cholesterol transporter of the SecD family, 12 transmembrane domain, related n=1 Tax=Neospora caninum (strain Liverpool) TaxID=572307 RepID=F0VLM1_NEOCL|nr:Niemann-Pick type C1 disease protein/ patched like cholesterol transporter of the SecD family, 12 transmembrane domain, related [Neospora caninum Liverpool]CBZ54149.1 Niemann-Pick type C1 disease protein/ patched like cholesterol transporter of the SecD family, 12 transmembrane domain, related [Neospora caninum Liverpool]|eukprot:XP_003884180.1 Niemann-Pick type C1 disease protein/ patched like cholesterol transporter of the SecD family, 12 transmembrane domain, related [Neospora caninum Liverpool]
MAAASSDTLSVGGSNSAGAPCHYRLANFHSFSPQGERSSPESRAGLRSSGQGEQSEAFLFQHDESPAEHPIPAPDTGASGVQTPRRTRGSYIASCGNWSDLDFSSIIWTRRHHPSPGSLRSDQNATEQPSAPPFNAQLCRICNGCRGNGRSCLKGVRKSLFSCATKAHAECAWPSRYLNAGLSRLGDRLAFHIVEHPDFFLKRAVACGVVLLVLALVSAAISFGTPGFDPNATLRLDRETASRSSASTELPSLRAPSVEEGSARSPHVFGEDRREGRLSHRSFLESNFPQNASGSSSLSRPASHRVHADDRFVGEPVLSHANASSSASASATALASPSGASPLQPSSSHFASLDLPASHAAASTSPLSPAGSAASSPTSSPESGTHVKPSSASGSSLASSLAPPSAGNTSFTASEALPANQNSLRPARGPSRLAVSKVVFPRTSAISFPVESPPPAVPGGERNEGLASDPSTDACSGGRVCSGEARTPASFTDTWERRVLARLAEALRVRYVAGAALFLPETSEARKKGEKMKSLFGEDTRATTMLYVNEKAMHMRLEEAAEFAGGGEKVEPEAAGVRANTGQARGAGETAGSNRRAIDLASREASRQERAAASALPDDGSVQAMRGSVDAGRNTKHGRGGLSPPGSTSYSPSLSVGFLAPGSVTPADVPGARSGAGGVPQIQRNAETAADNTLSLPSTRERQRDRPATEEARRRRLSEEADAAFSLGEKPNPLPGSAHRLRASPADRPSQDLEKDPLKLALQSSSSPGGPVPTTGLLSREVLREIWASQRGFQDDVEARGKTWRDLCSATPTATTAAGSPCIAVGLFGIYEVAAGAPLDSPEAFEDAFDGAQTGNVTLLHYAAAYVPSSFYTPVRLTFDSPLAAGVREETHHCAAVPGLNREDWRENGGVALASEKTQGATLTPHDSGEGEGNDPTGARRISAAPEEIKRKVKTPFDFRLASADALLFVYELDSSKGSSEDLDAWESAASAWAVNQRERAEARWREKRKVERIETAERPPEAHARQGPRLREKPERRADQTEENGDRSRSVDGVLSILSRYFLALASYVSSLYPSSSFASSGSFPAELDDSDLRWSVHLFNSQVASRESVFTVARETPLLVYTFGLVSLFLFLVFASLGGLPWKGCLSLTLGVHAVTVFSVAGGFCLGHLLFRIPLTPLAPLVLHLLLGFVAQFSVSTLLQLRQARGREAKKRQAQQHPISPPKDPAFAPPSRLSCGSHAARAGSVSMTHEGDSPTVASPRYEDDEDDPSLLYVSPLFPGVPRSAGCIDTGFEAARAPLVARGSLPLQLPSAGLPLPQELFRSARHAPGVPAAYADVAVARGTSVGVTASERPHPPGDRRVPWQQLVLRSDGKLRIMRRVISSSFSGLLLTTVTCVAALLLASSIDLPAVAYFSHAAASAVFSLFFFHIFLFCPLLVRLEQPSLAVGTPECPSGVQTLPPGASRLPRGFTSHSPPFSPHAFTKSGVAVTVCEGSVQGPGCGEQRRLAGGERGCGRREDKGGEEVEVRRDGEDRKSPSQASVGAAGEDLSHACCFSLLRGTENATTNRDSARLASLTLRRFESRGIGDFGDDDPTADFPGPFAKRFCTSSGERCVDEVRREADLTIDGELSPLGPEETTALQTSGVPSAFRSRLLHVDNTPLCASSSSASVDSVSSPASRRRPRDVRGKAFGQSRHRPETPLGSTGIAADRAPAAAAPPRVFVSGAVVARPFPGGTGARRGDSSDEARGEADEHAAENPTEAVDDREIGRGRDMRSREAKVNLVCAGLGGEDLMSEDSDDSFARGRDDEEDALGYSQRLMFTDIDGARTREGVLPFGQFMPSSDSRPPVGVPQHASLLRCGNQEEKIEELGESQRKLLTLRRADSYGKEEERSDFRTPRSDGATSGELLVYAHPRRDEGSRESDESGGARASDVGRRSEEVYAIEQCERRGEASPSNGETQNRSAPAGIYRERRQTPERNRGGDPRRERSRRREKKGTRVWDFFTRRRNRRVVLTVFFLLTVTSGLLSRHLSAYFDLLTYLSRDSPLLSFFNAVVFFWPAGLPSKLYLVLPGEDVVGYRDLKQRRKIITFLEELETLHEVQGPVLSWITDLEAHVNGTSSATAPEHVPPMITPECPYISPDATQPLPFPFEASRFNARVREWTGDGNDTLCTLSSLQQNDTGKTAGEKAPWLQNVIPSRYDSSYIRNGSRIEASRIMLMGVYRPDDPRANVETKGKLENLTREKLGVDGAFVYADWFEEAERDERIYSMVAKQLLVVAGGLGIFLAFFLSPVGGLLVAVLLVAISLIVASCLVVIGASIDVISLIALFMCVTFTVEYGTHIIYLFLHTGDKHSRVDSRVSPLVWDGEHWQGQPRLMATNDTTASRRAAIRVWKCARRGLPTIALSATASFLGEKRKHVNEDKK